MGIEQGTPVSDFDIDLFLNKDLTDPRLPRAFKGWNQFSQHHHQQIERIGTLHPVEVISLSKELAGTIGKTIGIDAESYKLSLSEKKIVKLIDVISGHGNRVIFMRHPEQSPPEWISSLSNPALRKIRMMQDPFNRQDLLSNNGLVDVFVTALALLHVRDATGKTTRIFSSENLRAKEAAYIFSIVIPGSGLATLEGLNCITYKNEMDQPPMTDEDLLADLPSGMMPWNPDLVDRLCKRPKSGMSPSEAIISTIGGLVDYGDRKNGNKMAIALTHNQQIAEVLRATGKLDDPSARFPELTMFVPARVGGLTIFRKGVLAEDDVMPKVRSMRKILENLGEGYEWYKVRRTEYETDQKIPFLVSPKPLYLPKVEDDEIRRIGKDVVDFMHAANELYNFEGDVKDLLDRGKPKIFQTEIQPRYLFVRPDLLITNQGFSICEIETSPFGLALSELLNRGYRAAGFDTMVGDEVLQNFLRDNIPDEGVIVFSQKTSSYEGQLEFLARELFSGDGRRWKAEDISTVIGRDHPHIYRGFYQYEFLEDLFVNNLVDNLLREGLDTVTPTLTPHMEEKALLSLVWDKRWAGFFSRHLGSAAFHHLIDVIPPTWIVGQERYFALGLPSGVSASVDLAGLSKSKRKFVLKKSGFGSGSSWAEGVVFLQEKSIQKARDLLDAATSDTQSLYVIQEFRPSQERPLLYEDDKGGANQMQARIRITPYFSMAGSEQAKLIAIKATGCENTNYIHASTGSINTAVAML